jgi:hypothetical protein
MPYAIKNFSVQNSFQPLNEVAMIGLPFYVQKYHIFQTTFSFWKMLSVLLVQLIV